jgi:hypothetical protein
MMEVKKTKEKLSFFSKLHKGRISLFYKRKRFVGPCVGSTWSHRFNGNFKK